MTHRNFCLDGDSIIEFDLPGGTKDGFRRIYKTRIEDFVEKWHKGSKEHKHAFFKARDLSVVKRDRVYTAKEICELVGYKTASNIRGFCREGKILVENKNKKRSDDFLILGENFINFYNKMGVRKFSLKDRLSNMKIRQINEKTGRIQTSNVVDCFYSGEKEVYEVVSECGEYKVSGSKDHLILTDSGWKKIKDIIPSVDSIIVSAFGKEDHEKVDPKRLKKIDGQWRSDFQRKIRAKKELELNGVCEICKSKKIKDIHHLVPVYIDKNKAFDEDNVVAVCDDCHSCFHSKQGWQGGTYLYGRKALVKEISYKGNKKTYDLEIGGEFPNFIANGIVVHNSRNSASSRAIKIEKMLELVKSNPAIPIHWGKNKPGMQAEEELESGEDIWIEASLSSAHYSKLLMDAGYHKQIVNRITEPFQVMKVIVSATEWWNFFHLRCHKDAQPEIQDLANKMYDLYTSSNPLKLSYGEWHLPYIDIINGKLYSGNDEVSLESAIKISTSCCAQVSFRNVDMSIEKAERIHNMLVGSYPLHGSALEHCATPFDNEEQMSRNLAYRYCSDEIVFFKGNFRGWTQYRKLFNNENNNHEFDRKK